MGPRAVAPLEGSGMGPGFAVRLERQAVRDLFSSGSCSSSSGIAAHPRCSSCFPRGARCGVRSQGNDRGASRHPGESGPRRCPRPVGTVTISCSCGAGAEVGIWRRSPKGPGAVTAPSTPKERTATWASSGAFRELGAVHVAFTRGGSALTVTSSGVRKSPGAVVSPSIPGGSTLTYASSGAVKGTGAIVAPRSPKG